MQITNLALTEEFDRDLRQRVTQYLHQKGSAPHRTLEISVERGVVVVRGRVPTFYLRQIAVECIKRVAGVTQVVDLIEVADRPNQRHAKDNAEDDHIFPDLSFGAPRASVRRGTNNARFASLSS